MAPPAASSTLSTYVLTFNCARNPINPSTFSAHIFSAFPQSSPLPQLLILCLQEIAPIAYSFLGGTYLQSYTRRFEQAVEIAAAAAAKAGDTRDVEHRYRNVVTKNVGMTAIMIFATEDYVDRLKEVETAEVGVGVLGMGNKGAVGVRLLCESARRQDGHEEGADELEFRFVSAHLAPMEEACERRNQDFQTIARRLVFEVKDRPSVSGGQETEAEDTALLASTRSSGADSTSLSGIYHAHSHLVFAGDLNYRTASKGPMPEDQSLFPQPCEDDSYPQHFEHLLISDQLTKEKKAGRTCQLLKEAPIDFPPTYKYSDRARRDLQKGDITPESMDHAEDGIWKWALHRWPSWCDRILYLDTSPWSNGSEPVVKHYTALPLLATSDHRPVACHFEIPVSTSLKASQQGFESPFTIDSNWRWKRQLSRQLEILVGISALLTTTTEGLLGVAVIVLVTIAGSTGYVLWSDS